MGFHLRPVPRNLPKLKRVLGLGIGWSSTLTHSSFRPSTFNRTNLMFFLCIKSYPYSLYCDLSSPTGSSFFTPILSQTETFKRLPAFNSNVYKLVWYETRENSIYI